MTSMTKKFLNRRGVTPLMITILLVSFAVAVGVMVMNFGSAEVEESAQCPVNVDLKFAIVSNSEDVCYDSASQILKFTVENGINVKVEGLVVNLIGEKRAESYEMAALIIKAGSYRGEVNYDASASGALRQVKITPKIKLYDAEDICVEQAIVFENIKEC